MITPFAADLSLDEEAVVFHVSRLAEAGVGASLGTASPGEGHSLTLAETERFWGLAKDTAAGRVPVMAMGCEPRSAAEFMPQIRIAESLGLDSMQLYSVDLGHGNHPAPKELERYFRTMLDDMAIPARLSSHKAAGYNIPLPVLERLLDDYPNIVAVHCIAPDSQYLRRTVEICEGRADVLTGGLHDVLNNLSFGGQGYLDSTCSLLVPKTCRAVIDGFADGKLDAMYSAFEQAYAVSMVNRWTGPRTVKEAVRIAGLPGWHLRPPYLALDPDEAVLMAGILDAAEAPELTVLPFRSGR
jgi:4-hydroxy-tetrahydrodipicolinate synthase